jgi:hypothetical protein
LKRGEDMKKNQMGEHGVITRVVGAEYFDGGCESFTDAIDEMMRQWRAIPSRGRATIAKRGYRNESGDAYMTAVADYDDETGVAWEAMTLAEVMEAMAEDEEDE